MDANKEHTFDSRLVIFAVTVMILLIIYLFCVTFIPVPASNRDFANMGLGIIGPLLAGIIGYYWGASKARNDNDKTISSMANKIPDAPTLSILPIDEKDQGNEQAKNNAG